MTADLATADRFLDSYLMAAGHAPYNYWWDLATAMSFINSPIDTSGWEEVGRTDITPARAVTATEEFLISALDIERPLCRAGRDVALSHVYLVAVERVTLPDRFEFRLSFHDNPSLPLRVAVDLEDTDRDQRRLGDAQLELTVTPAFGVVQQITAHAEEPGGRRELLRDVFEYPPGAPAEEFFQPRTWDIALDPGATAIEVGIAFCDDGCRPTGECRLDISLQPFDVRSAELMVSENGTCELRQVP